MRTVAATEIPSNIAHLLFAAAKEPVALQQAGFPRIVMLSAEEYQRLESYEDAYWIQKAEAGEASGHVGAEEFEAFFRERLGA